MHLNPYSIVLCITVYNIYILPLYSNHKIASVKIGKLEHTKPRSQVEAKTHIRQETFKHVVPEHTTIRVHVTQHQEGPRTSEITLNNQSRGEERKGD